MIAQTIVKPFNSNIQNFRNRNKTLFIISTKMYTLVIELLVSIIPADVMRCLLNFVQTVATNTKTW